MSAFPIGIAVIRPPEEAELLEVASQAAASHLHLITDGRETVLSPIIPPGWYRIGVRVKDAP